MGWAGGMTLTRVLARGLLRAGHDVIVACDPGSALESKLSQDGVPTAAVSVGRGPLVSFRALRRLVRERGADVLHVYGAKSHSAGLAVALTVPRLAFVVTRGRARRPGSDLVSRLKFRSRRIDGYIAVSGAVRDALVSGGVSPDRVGVVPVGYDDEVIRPATPAARAAARAALGLPAAAPVVGVLGNWAPEKGQAVFLEALARLAPERPALRAILAGWGTDGPGARAAIHRGGLEGMVLGLGYRADVPLLLSALDVAVVPSLDEAAGIALVEAMAAGLPVAASDVGGIPEVMGETGVRVAPGDAGALASAISHLLDDADEASRLGEAARVRAVREFGGAALAARTVARYEAALARRRKANGKL